MLLAEDIAEVSVTNQRTGEVLAVISEENGMVDTFNDDIVVIVKPKTNNGGKKHENASDPSRR
jgi:hypothetical protein